VDGGLLTLSEQTNAPVDHALLNHQVDDSLSYSFFELHTALGTHFLEDGNDESLGDLAVLLFFEDFNHLVHDAIILLTILETCNVLNTLASAYHHRDKSRESMLEFMTVHVQHLHNKV
jgi:hypothetical protein